MIAKYFPLLLVTTVLAACTTPVTVHKIRGQEDLRISCSGMGSSWEKCTRKAEKVCRPNGYRVLGKSSDYADDPSDGFMGWTPGMYSRTLIVHCNPVASDNPS